MKGYVAVIDGIKCYGCGEPIPKNSSFMSDKDDYEQKIYCLRCGMEKTFPEMPVIQLKNGLVVGNFSSPHEFKFDDGSVLGGCDKERASKLMLQSEEQEIPGESERGKWTNIMLCFSLSPEVEQELEKIHQNAENLDIVLVPFPVMEAVKRAGKIDKYPKIRVVRVKDRVEKIIYSDRYCV